MLTRLDEALESRVLSSASYRGVLTAIVLVPNLVVLLPDPYWLLSLLAFLGFLPALQAMRGIESSGLVQTCSFHPSNLLAYLIGTPFLAFIVLLSIGFLPATAVVTGDQLWERDIEYLREAEILGPDEEIDYFYSGGFWSIEEDGQFISDEYVTTYYQDPGTGEMYWDYAAYSEIRNIDVSWAKTSRDATVVTITAHDGRQFELWLSSESGGDREFVAAMMENWRKSQSSAGRSGGLISGAASCCGFRCNFRANV